MFWLDDSVGEPKFFWWDFESQRDLSLKSEIESLSRCRDMIITILVKIESYWKYPEVSRKTSTENSFIGEF